MNVRPFSEFSFAHAAEPIDDDDAVRPAPGSWVLLLGNCRPTLSIARALSAHGFKIMLGISEHTEPDASRRSEASGAAAASRHVDEVWVHPPFTPDKRGAFARALRRLLDRRRDIETVFPVSRDVVLWLGAHGDTLSPDLIVAAPDPSVVENCLDTTAISRIARRNEIACQKSASVSKADGLSRAGRRIGYPLTVKSRTPGAALAGKTELRVANHESLLALARDFDQREAGFILRAHRAGERHNQYFAANDGEIIRLVETRTIRTEHADSTGSTVEGEFVAPSADLCLLSSILVETLCFTGIGCLRYLRDRDTGEPSLIGIEPHVAGSHLCAEAMGTDLAWLAVQLASGHGERLNAIPYSYEPGDRFVWPGGEWQAMLAALKSGEARLAETAAQAVRMAYGLLRADVYPVWDWRDPLPSLSHLLRRWPAVTKLLRRPAEQDGAQKSARAANARA